MNKTDFLKFLSAFEISTAKIERILQEMGDTYTFERFVNSEAIKKILDNDFSKIAKRANDKFMEDYSNYLLNKNVKLVTCENENFPKKLLQIENHPFYLFYLGDLNLLNQKCVAIVGTRSPSSYGITVTERFSGEIAEAGGVIVSGLAYGVDSIAHRKALAVGGKTIAVLAGGFDHIYPQEHFSLFKEIAQKGLVISEHRPDVIALKYHFPQRNRIVAGISDALLITEAGKKSGTTITKDFALDYGVPIYAVPGNINSVKSEGTNSLIATMQGICALNTSDIINDLGLSVKKRASVQLSLQEHEILKALKNGDLTIDQICDKTKLNINSLNSLLTTLEIKGIIKRLPGGFYSLD